MTGDRRGTSQLKRAEQTLQEKARSLEEQLERSKAQHAEDIRRLQGQLEKHAARVQLAEEQEGGPSLSSLFVCEPGGPEHALLLLSFS